MTTCTPCPSLNHHIPANLWIGVNSLLEQEVTFFLQKQFCLQSQCGACTTCALIASRQFWAVRWLAPEKSTYTSACLEPLKHHSAYKLAPQEQFYFIITQADLLSPATANSLLKLLEEPAPGYFFILLAPSAETVLETIRSRCAIKIFNHPQQHHELFTQLLALPSPADFLLFLEKQTVGETPAYQAAYHALFHYNSLLQTQNSPHVVEIIARISHLLKVPPMPGGAKIFLKQLYLIIHQQELQKS